MQMCAQELAICAIHNIPVKVAIINNRVLGMVRQWQELIYDNRYSHIDLAGSPDFVKLAEAYGVRGFRATTKEEAEQAWTEALNTPGPAVVEFVVRRYENVYPMVTQGCTIDQMIMGIANETDEAHHRRHRQRSAWRIAARVWLVRPPRIQH